jgi:hypothetical protein
MTYLYSLYDALVAINVPFDKARAVVDAMERDMGTTLATKEDLRVLRIELTQEVALVQKDLDAKYLLLRQEFESTRSELRQDVEALRSSLTIRLGSMLVVGLGLLFAALRLG